jgi:hypothetical protein
MPALAAERRWFAPERAVPGLRDITGELNAVWGAMLAAEVLASLMRKKKVYGLRQCINNLASWLLTTLYIGERQLGGICWDRLMLGLALLLAKPLHSHHTRAQSTPCVGSLHFEMPACLT